MLTKIQLRLFFLLIEEKSLGHVAMVAKFLDDNKAKTSLKEWIPRTVSNFIDLIQFPFNF